MSRKTKITLTVITVILAAVLIGFIYDAIMTAVEKRNYPQKYEAEVAAASEKYGVPKHIIFAVIKTESNFDPDVKSSAGACGLMQLLPSTFSEMSGIADAERYIYDPQINIDAGTKYLAYLYTRYGNWETVYAAYNGGLGNVDEWLADKNYSSDGKTLTNIPYSETRAYVRRVSSAASAYERLY